MKQNKIKDILATEIQRILGIEVNVDELKMWDAVPKIG